MKPLPADALPESAAAVLAAAGVGAGSRVCCALSGGADSVVLFELLRRLQPRFGFGLLAAHVDHGLSPNAPAWARACVERCAAAGIPLQVLRVEVDRAHADGLEAAARTARHAALAQVDCDWLAFGHHQDDQAETVLFRLLRGTGVRGAAAMRAVEPGRAGRAGWLRPLLGLRRAQLLEWAGAHGLDWVEDESNADLRFTRNALRHRLLPVAEGLFPAAVPNLARAAAHFAEADALLGELAAIDAAACGAPALRRADFLALTPARQANLLRWLLLGSGAPLPGSLPLGEALRQLRECDPAHPLRLPLGAWACCAYRDRVWVEPAQPPAPQGLCWQGEVVMRWGGDEVRLVASIGEGLERARLERAAEVRLAPRGEGLRLRLHPARPRRELRKLCQEAAIPAWLRDRLPVLWVDGEPAWVGGIGVAAEFACAPRAPGLVPEWRPGGMPAPTSPD
jgi:tRNA(Ile)-lysidine synthase